MHWLANVVQNALNHWGYLALIVGLVGEDAGLPLPGETVLMLASFLATKDHQLSLWIIVPVGIAAAIAGDNCGFWAGRWLGPHLIRFLKKKLKIGDDVAVAEDLIHRHGGATVFWARYIFGLRTVAGPVAGALGMKWKRFFVFNSLGGCTWVAFITLIGYAFANEFNNFVGYFEKASWAISGGIFIIGYFLWRREKKEYRQQHPEVKQQTDAQQGKD
jgi:membrane protein DedA with SNARE-associated domain